jgi:hypothetical protein
MLSATIEKDKSIIYEVLLGGSDDEEVDLNEVFQAIRDAVCRADDENMELRLQLIAITL